MSFRTWSGISIQIEILKQVQDDNCLDKQIVFRYPVGYSFAEMVKEAH